MFFSIYLIFYNFTCLVKNGIIDMVIIVNFIIILISLFLGIINVQAHDTNIKGYNEKNAEHVSACGGKYYGYHKKNGTNHWHEVEYSKGKWIIVDSKKSYKNDPCQKEIKKRVLLKNCVDGDTAVFVVDKEELKFRFLAVDTPESVHPNKKVEDYAKESSSNTCDLLTNAKKIEVEYDSNGDKTDKYGRHLAWVWIDDILLQKVLISGGYARVAYIYGNYKYVDELCQIQSDAIESKVGIWNYGYEVGYCSAHNPTVSAEYKGVNIYNVTFDNNGDKKNITIAEGMQVKEPKVESKVGFKFIGWFSKDSKYDFNNKVSEDLYLKAKYEIDYIFLASLIGAIIVCAFTTKRKRKKIWKK